MGKDQRILNKEARAGGFAHRLTFVLSALITTHPKVRDPAVISHSSVSYGWTNQTFLRTSNIRSLQDAYYETDRLRFHAVLALISRAAAQDSATAQKDLWQSRRRPVSEYASLRRLRSYRCTWKSMLPAAKEFLIRRSAAATSLTGTCRMARPSVWRQASTFVSSPPRASPASFTQKIGTVRVEASSASIQPAESLSAPQAQIQYPFLISRLMVTGSSVVAPRQSRRPFNNPEPPLIRSRNCLSFT
jgi:hypothetical protein